MATAGHDCAFWGGVLGRALLLWAAVSVAQGEQPAGTMAVTVSAERAKEQRYDVTFRCEGLRDMSLDFKMPAWTPGYYKIMDYAQNVQDFRAEDGGGKPLAWEKINRNTWRVKSGDDDVVVVSYAVLATSRFVAESQLDEEQGYVSPTSAFMYVAGQLEHSVTVTVRPFSGWKDVATGLDPVDGEPFTFCATNFDVLYDCPILMGNLETIKFEVLGIPHSFVGRNLGSFDRAEFVADMTRLIVSAVAIIGEIPYKHYTFLAIGPHPGGIEHANSAALSFGKDDGAGSAISPTHNKRWMSFVAHEYFHLYNAKRIRPIELGPFDYDKENYTDMLWVAEGFTVYYEHLILKRAGLIGRDEVLESLRASVRGYESRPGRLHQSATESSRRTWHEGPFGGDRETTISCYDKGAALGMLLDFKIRHETQNRKSLDDVMRALYYEFYRDKNRGYTEQEFQEVCERVAGCPLTELFEYASTVKPIDYPKYLGYAGLDAVMPEGDVTQESFRMKVVVDANELQKSILANWLGDT